MSLLIIIWIWFFYYQREIWNTKYLVNALWLVVPSRNNKSMEYSLKLLQIGLAIMFIMLSMYLKSSVYIFAFVYTISIIIIGIIVTHILSTYQVRNHDMEDIIDLPLRLIIYLLIIFWISIILLDGISTPLLYKNCFN